MQCSVMCCAVEWCGVMSGSLSQGWNQSLAVVPQGRSSVRSGTRPSRPICTLWGCNCHVCMHVCMSVSSMYACMVVLMIAWVKAKILDQSISIQQVKEVTRGKAPADL